MNKEQWDQMMRNDGVANMAGGSRQDYVDPPWTQSKRTRERGGAGPRI